MFLKLQEINTRPAPFEFYTASDLWTDEHTSAQMLEYHLNDTVDLSSRRSEFIDRSASWITSHFDLNAKKSIADFGCGPGLYTSRLAGSGAKVTGIDFSENSIQYAKGEAAKQGSPINYVRGNYLEFETDERFDLITMIMCDFCALSPEQRKTMLQKWESLLKPGGRVLLDAYSLSAFAKREEAVTYEPNQLNGFWSPDPYFGFLNTFKYNQPKVVLDKFTIIEKARTRIVYNWLQYFDCDSLAKEFEDCGLTVDAFFGNVAGADFDPNADEFAIVGHKS